MTRPRLLPAALLALLALSGAAAAKPYEKPVKPGKPGRPPAAAPAVPEAPAAAPEPPVAAPTVAPLPAPDTLPPLPPTQAALPAPRPSFPSQPALDPQPGALAGLAAWVGCAPHCPAAAGRLGQRLRSSFVLHYPPLRQALEQMLGRRPLADLLRVAETGPPVERQGAWIRIALCRQEACATQFVVLFAHLQAGELMLCWHDERWEPQRLRWSDNHGGVWRTGLPGRQPLPPEGCNNRGPLEGHDWDLLRRLADQ